MGTRISNDFLAASAAAAKDLATAQVRRAVLEAKADERLVQAQQPTDRGLGYFPDQSGHPAHLRFLRSSGHTTIDRKSLQTGMQGR